MANRRVRLFRRSVKVQPQVPTKHLLPIIPITCISCLGWDEQWRNYLLM